MFVSLIVGVPTVNVATLVEVVPIATLPLVFREAKVPTLVRLEPVTPEARVVPVKLAAGTAFAVMLVLHPNPVFVVQIKAEEAELHPPTERAVTFAVPLVAFPNTVLVAT